MATLRQEKRILVIISHLPYPQAVDQVNATETQEALMASLMQKMMRNMEAMEAHLDGNGHNYSG